MFLEFNLLKKFILKIIVFLLLAVAYSFFFVSHLYILYIHIRHSHVLHLSVAFTLHFT